MVSVMAASERALNITSGPVFSVDCFESGSDQLLFLVAHHLVIDLVSWRIIIQNLEEYLQYGQLADEHPPTSFHSWSALQAQYARDHLSLHSVLPFDVPFADALYWGLEDRKNCYSTATTQSFTLTTEHTSALLHAANQAYSTDPVDIFIAALLHSFTEIFRDREAPSIFLEGHGREPMHASVDLSSTVGWFTTMAPVHLRATHSSDVVDAVRRVKDRRRKLLNNGWQYFTARYANADGTDAFPSHWPMEVLLNYMGQYQQLERTDALLREEPRTNFEGVEDIAGDVTRLAFFEVSAVVIHGIARFDFTFSKEMRHQTEIGHWIDTFQECLTHAATVLPGMDPEKTLSDFPLMSLSYSGLEMLRKGPLADAGFLDLDNIEDIYPCSPMQQGLLLSQTKSNGLYQLRFSFEVTSTRTSVTAQKMFDAWQQLVVLRNSSPRTRRMTSSDDEVMRALNTPQSAEEDRYLPPHRLVIIEGKTKLVCSWEMSHAIVDAFSIGMILGQLTDAYQGSLRAPPARFSEYISHIQSKGTESALQYWSKNLQGVEPCHLPLDGNAGDRAKLQSQKVDLQVKPAALYSFCQAHGVTIANLFQTVWALVLNAVTGSDDVCFGYLATGREALEPGLSEVLGPLINLLVCRVIAAPGTQVRDLVQNVQRDYVTSLEHQDCSLAQIQHALKLSGTPLFNTIMSIQPLGSNMDDNDAILRFRSIDSHDPTEYDVAVNIGFSSTEVDVTLNYWSPALSDWQATNVCHTLDAVLGCIVGGPSQLVGGLDLFSDRHFSQLSAIIGSQNSVEAVESTIPALFAEQVALTPSAPALCAWDGNLTFQQLDDISDRIAQLLVTLGVQPEVIVPTCFDKSIWYTVAALSVMKAGGAWAALDPSHPPARHQAILQDIKATVVMTTSTYHSRLAAHVSHIICLDQALVDSLPPPARASSSITPAKPNNLAYVVFTSGSTGTPKGILVEHVSVCSSMKAHGAVLHIGPGDRVLQFSAHVFDLSIQEIFTSLIHGACVCVPSEAQRVNDLPGVMRQLRVTAATLTPTVCCTFRLSDVSSLRLLIFGGEAGNQEAHDLWRGIPVLANCYGPAEATIYCICNTDLSTSTHKVTNIGTPTGCRPWVVHPNDHHRLVPVGCVGELVIEGPLVSRGYLNDPVKTEAVFVENLAWAEQSELPARPRRFYKTGDLVHYHADGTLQYLGRKDSQVKVHGHRIELGEVETHIKSLMPNIAQVAVELVSQPGRGDRTLAAFLCFSESISVEQESPGELLLPVTDAMRLTLVANLEALTRSMPAYMIPSLFVPLRHLPLNLSAKTDRSKLRRLLDCVPVEALTSYRLAQETVQQPPSTPLERRLHGLWSQVLDLPGPSIGVTTPFVQLGGDSITAMYLVSAAREAGISFSVAELFQASTIANMAEIAQYISEDDNTSSDSVEPFTLIDAGDISLDSLLDEVTAQFDF